MSVSVSNSPSSSFWSQISTTHLLLTTLLSLIITTLTLASLLLPRVYRILTSPPPSRPHNANATQQHKKGHLLILLGSGGHTAEMFSILRGLGSEYLDTRFDRRTWVVSSGDGFSSERVGGFEEELAGERRKIKLNGNGNKSGQRRERVERKRRMDLREELGRPRKEEQQEEHGEVRYTIRTVRRARRVHQSLLTTPISSLGCLWDCVCVLRGTETTEASPGYDYSYGYPDLILTNGPGTGVIMVFAALLLQFLGLAPITSRTSSKSLENGTSGAMRSIYIESWARVKSLSLSAKILRFAASRVLVQWRGVGGRDGDGDGVVDLTGVEIDREKEKERTSTSIQWPRKLEYVGAVIA